MLETTTSSMNRALRNSDGTSIIVRRLRRAEAEDEECNRRNGAAGAVDSENVQGLSLHTSQPSAVKSDDRITIQLEIEIRAAYGAGITLNSLLIAFDWNGAQSLPDQTKRMRAPSSGISVSFVLHSSPAATGKARVSVPVVTISPAASGGVSGSSASAAARWRRANRGPSRTLAAAP